MDTQSVERIVAFTVDEVSIKNSYAFRVPPTSMVGDGVAAKIGDYLIRFNSRKVFIVTDKVIVKLGLLKPMLRSLERRGIGYAIFDQVEPDPTDTVVEQGVSTLKHCNCDTVVAFGGGSALDAGKAIAVYTSIPFNLNQSSLDEMIAIYRMPLIAVPTTAGTGSEVTDVTVITDTKTHIKVPLAHPALIPDMAVIDPTLTLGIPPIITAATGVDVLSHAIESYMAKGVCTLGQALSFAAMKLVANNLRLAVGDGSNLEARHKMAEASYMAGMSFSNAGLGLCHAIAHQIGAAYHVAHGAANGLVLPEVMRFNMLVRTEQSGEIARAFNQKIENLDPKDAALKGITAVRELIEEVGLPTRLREVGANESDFEALAKQALVDPTIITNPRSVRLEDVVQILKQCY
jgi:alcohol dehydrogenase class IV